MQLELNKVYITYGNAKPVYYYVYWKDDSGKLKKKYIGTRYDESWKHHKKPKTEC